MKKFLAVALMMGAFVGANAANHGEKPQPVEKAKTPTIVISEWNCGTGEEVVWGECWTGTATVTICCECSQAQASIEANLRAREYRQLLISVVQALEEIDPC